MCSRWVEVVERARDQQVRVGVEVLRELVALVAQVALDLEFDVVMELVFVGAHRAAEFLGHVGARQIGDVPDHAGHAQPAFRHDAVRVVVAAVKVRVRADRGAGHFVERDVLRRELRCRRRSRRSARMRCGYWIDHDSACMPPSEPPITAAQRSMPSTSATRACASHPVLDRHDRKARAVRCAGAPGRSTSDRWIRSRSRGC